MSEAPAAPKAPLSPDAGGRGFELVGSALLVAMGLVYVPVGVLLGAELGAGFSLDPTWPWQVGLAGHGLTTLVFAGAGALMALASVVFAVGVVGWKEWAPAVGGALAIALLCTGNLPGGLLAFGVAVAAKGLPRPGAVPTTSPSPGPSAAKAD